MWSNKAKLQTTATSFYGSIHFYIWLWFYSKFFLVNRNINSVTYCLLPIFFLV